jgi:hypothetical protein
VVSATEDQHRVAGETFAGHTHLRTLTCIECGVMFAVPDAMLGRQRTEPGRPIYCPNGHENEGEWYGLHQ